MDRNHPFSPVIFRVSFTILRIFPKAFIKTRYDLLKCSNILGGVVFANAVTTTNQDKGVKLFEYIRPSVGLGLRILFQKQSRMNIQVDYAQGEDSNGVYFGASEVF